MQRISGTGRVRAFARDGCRLGAALCQPRERKRRATSTVHLVEGCKRHARKNRRHALAGSLCIPWARVLHGFRRHDSQWLLAETGMIRISAVLAEPLRYFFETQSRLRRHTMWVMRTMVNGSVDLAAIRRRSRREPSRRRKPVHPFA